MSYFKEIVRLVSGPRKVTESWDSRACEGYLKKEGSNFKTWKERYFVLSENGYLFYFKSESNMKEPLNHFPVNNLEWVQCKNKQKGMEVLQHCIEITRSPPLFLSHSDGAELEKWKKALTKVGCKMSLTTKEKKLPIVFIYDMRERKDQWKLIKQKLYDSVGKKINITVDWDAYASNPNLDTTDGSVVRTIYEYLLNLATSIEQSCKAGDIEREAFINGVYKSAIKVYMDTSMENYHSLALEDGELCLKTKDSFANVHLVGSNLEELYQFAGDQEVPLAIRKSIRDSNKYLLECVDAMKSLSGGQNFSLEVDWKSLVSCESIQRKDWDNIAEIIFNKYFRILLKKITDFCQDETLWKTFFENVVQKKISFSIKKIDSYHATQLVGGVFHLYVSDKYWNYNIDSVGDDFIKSIQRSGDNEIPLDIRNATLEAEPKRLSLLQRLKDLTGHEYDITVDWTTISASIEEKQYGMAPTVVYDDYLGSLIGKLEEICKDEMVKEEFIRVIPLRQIHFTMVPLENVYHALRITPEGSLNIECKIDDGWTINSNSCGEKIEELLNHSLDDASLPLKVRKSIRDAEEYKISAIEAFRSIGNRDYVIEVDWIGLVKSESIDKNQWDRLGEFVFKSYLLTLGKNIMAISNRNSIISESFQEHTSAAKITFGIEVLPNGQYHSIHFKNGVLCVTSAQGGWYTNVGNIGKVELVDELSQQDEELGKTPLSIRLLADEKKDEYEVSLKVWQSVAGENATIVIDCESIVNNVEKKDWTTVIQKLYEEVLPSLAQNFVAILSKSNLVLQGSILRLTLDKSEKMYNLDFNQSSKEYILSMNSPLNIPIESIGLTEIESLLIKKSDSEHCSIEINEIASDSNSKNVDVSNDEEEIGEDEFVDPESPSSWKDNSDFIPETLEPHQPSSDKDVETVDPPASEQVEDHQNRIENDEHSKVSEQPLEKIEFEQENESTENQLTENVVEQEKVAQTEVIGYVEQVEPSDEVVDKVEIRENVPVEDDAELSVTEDVIQNEHEELLEDSEMVEEQMEQQIHNVEFEQSAPVEPESEYPEPSDDNAKSIISRDDAVAECHEENLSTESEQASQIVEDGMTRNEEIIANDNVAGSAHFNDNVDESEDTNDVENSIPIAEKDEVVESVHDVDYSHDAIETAQSELLNNEEVAEEVVTEIVNSIENNITTEHTDHNEHIEQLTENDYVEPSAVGQSECTEDVKPEENFEEKVTGGFNMISEHSETTIAAVHNIQTELILENEESSEHENLEENQEAENIEQYEILNLEVSNNCEVEQLAESEEYTKTEQITETETEDEQITETEEEHVSENIQVKESLEETEATHNIDVVQFTKNEQIHETEGDHIIEDVQNTETEEIMEYKQATEIIQVIDAAKITEVEHDSETEQITETEDEQNTETETEQITVTENEQNTETVDEYKNEFVQIIETELNTEEEQISEDVQISEQQEDSEAAQIIEAEQINVVELNNEIAQNNEDEEFSEQDLVIHSDTIVDNDSEVEPLSEGLEPTTNTINEEEHSEIAELNDQKDEIEQSIKVDESESNHVSADDSHDVEQLEHFDNTEHLAPTDNSENTVNIEQANNSLEESDDTKDTALAEHTVENEVENELPEENHSKESEIIDEVKICDDERTEEMETPAQSDV